MIIGCVQVCNFHQAERDFGSLMSMDIFESVTLSPQVAPDCTPENPKV